MFRQVTLGYFKSVKEPVEIDLSGLTVLTGSNSSGKSTVLQSLLLLAQTVRHSSPDRQLVLNGPLSQLGEFGDIRNFASPDRNVEIGVQIAPPVESGADDTAPQTMLRKARRPSFVSAHWSFSDRPVREADGVADGRTFPTVAALSISGYYDTGEAFEPVTLGIRRHKWRVERRASREGYEDLSEPNLNSLAWQVDRAHGLVAADVRGVVFDHCLPTGFTSKFNIQHEIARGTIETLAESRTRAGSASDEWAISPVLWDLIFDAVGGVVDHDSQNQPIAPKNIGGARQWLQSLPITTRRRAARRLQLDSHRIIADYVRNVEPIPWLWQSPLPEEIGWSATAARSELTKIRYLGPLRVQPAPLYPVATTLGAEDVGPSGEWTASVLDAYKAKVVTYLSPDSIPFGRHGQTSSAAPLLDAVREWMHYLGVADDVTTVDRGSMGHELRVVMAANGKPVPLTHVGVGVSQCLPVVVSLLLAGRGSLTLLEQPELHLHPAVQSRLADFLLAMSLSGRQCLVETHSEYMINRLRLRIAQSEEESVQTQVTILFASMRDGCSTFENVAVNEFGRIKNWPKGFFDSSQDDIEQLLVAAAAKRS